MGKYSGFLKTLGPGLLWAGAAIGVSHLVQSTRAGSIYGFSLVLIVLFANLFKYPFFEFAPRYTAAMGESLLHGYRRLGQWAIYLFFALTVLTMFTIQGAVTMVTAALATQLFGGTLSLLHWASILLVLCGALLAIGKYAVLDRMIKVVIIALAISTFAALGFALAGDTPPVEGFQAPTLWSSGGLAFMVALMGWMPSAIDISVWSSLWTLERQKQTGHRPTVKQAVWDLNIGYIGTVLIAMAFLSLGALVFFGSGQELSQKGTQFAAQVIEIYTASLGEWSRWFIATAAFCTMFSTTITCLDAFPRVLTQTTQLMAKRDLPKGRTYWISLIFVASGTLVLINMFTSRMTAMVDLATTLSFLTAPILATLNYRCVTGPWFPQEHQPPKWLKLLSLAGMIFLVGFSLVFIYWRFL